VTQDGFDSSLFGKVVYRIVPAGVLTSESELMEALPKDPGAMPYFFSPFSPPNFEVLARARFCLISVRQTYALRAITAVTDDSPMLKRLADVRTELESGELTNMAVLIGESSRYFKVFCLSWNGKNDLLEISYNFERRFTHAQENSEAFHCPREGRHSPAPSSRTHPRVGPV